MSCLFCLIHDFSEIFTTYVLIQIVHFIMGRRWSGERGEEEPKIKNGNFVNSLMVCHYVDQGKLFLSAPFYSNMDPFLNYPWASKKKLTDKSKEMLLKALEGIIIGYQFL